MAQGVGEQVAVFVVLTQTVGACLIASVPVFPLAAQIPVKIPEGDLPVLGDGLLNGVHVKVNGLVHAFDPPGNQHVPAHEPCVVDAALAAQFFNQLPGFFLREEPAGPDGVDEQLQFRQLKIPGGNVVAAVLPGKRDDVHAVILQGRDIRVDGFTVADNIVLLQHGKKLRRSHRVIQVRIFLQIIEDIEDFQLLIV